jgi:tRNA dimethylallyltransferase
MLQTDRVLAVAGPTAVGKTEVALLLAERLKGEIISVDSMQVYRGLEVGTAKPSPEERARVPHHLIDVVGMTMPFDAAKFVSLANQAVDGIRLRGRLPILCGGTGLYFKAFFEGLSQAPAGAPELRAALEATPVAELLSELSQRDPVTYERIDRQNRRRIVRALEAIRLTGKPFSAQQSPWSHSSHEFERGTIFGLARSTADLTARIDARVDAIFRRGLIMETEQLLTTGLAENRTALQALGYRQTVEHLQGSRGLAETIALVKIRTRQFAKRQMTWFKRQLPVQWIHIRPDQSAAQVADEICARYDQSCRCNAG